VRPAGVFSAARRGALPVSAGALAATLVGCLPAAATAEARAISDLYLAFIAIAVVVGAVVYGLATFAILRYRAARRPEMPAQTRGDIRIEAVWTAIPILIIAGLFAGTLVVLGKTEARSPQPGAELRVEAFRWGWSFSYPAAGVTIDGTAPTGPEAVVPVGEPVRITVASADVVHAFFVPVFLFKRDAIPGRESVFEVTIDEPGTYRGQCAEFCGVNHSRMPFSIRAVPRADFDDWLAGRQETAE
jgi:cytochrome c oxidase subunit II